MSIIYHIHPAIILGQINQKFGTYDIATEIDKKLY